MPPCPALGGSCGERRRQTGALPDQDSQGRGRGMTPKWGVGCWLQWGWGWAGGSRALPALGPAGVGQDQRTWGDRAGRRAEGQRSAQHPHTREAPSARPCGTVPSPPSQPPSTVKHGRHLLGGGQCPRRPEVPPTQKGQANGGFSKADVRFSHRGAAILVCTLGRSGSSSFAVHPCLQPRVLPTVSTPASSTPHALRAQPTRASLTSAPVDRPRGGASGGVHLLGTHVATAAGAPLARGPLCLLGIVRRRHHHDA